MTPAQQADSLTSLLQLAHEPIGVSGADAASPGEIRPAPSACTFWRRAERAAFSADAAAHANCKVGAHVMGFTLGAQDQAQLGELVATMTGVAYIAPEEVPAIPRLPEHKAWQYTPLRTATSPPELIFMWIDSRQAMLIQEAMGSAHWRAGKGLRTTGRPACGALALAYHNGAAVLSFGCAGMRTFTEISDGLMLFVLPGELAEAMCYALAQTSQANAAVQCLYDRQKALFTR
jgi:uncharacterized protein (DUF169 family)